MILAGFTGYAIYARKRGLGRLFFNATLIFFVSFIARDGMFAPDVLDYAGYLAIPTWVAASGVDLVSLGALTHSPRAIDFSFLLGARASSPAVSSSSTGHWGGGWKASAPASGAVVEAN